MTVTDFLLPVFVEVLLAFILLGLMGKVRSESITRGEIRTEDIALDNRNYTARARQFGNSFSNQFELPMLLFVLIAFILITRVGDLLLLILAWVFVISRIAHAYVHTTSNDVNWAFGRTGLERLSSSSCGSSSPSRF
ncbi:MAG TPA: MAPEG family protein [Hyphomicrobium sp.]|jgi:hypothetical protein